MWSIMRTSPFIFELILISLATGAEPQTEQLSTEISTRKEDDNGKGIKHPWKRETSNEICQVGKNVAVESVYVNLTGSLIQLFIPRSYVSQGWTSQITMTMSHKDTYPKRIVKYSTSDLMGHFRNVWQYRDSPDYIRVSASFVHFSNSPMEAGYLVYGLRAYQFKILTDSTYYFASDNVKPITDFFKEGDKKLLMPEDKLEEVVSVAIIKWVEKDKSKDHAIYKIILKTVTKKLVKSYFKINSKGEVFGHNSEPFVPSVEDMQDEDEFHLLEESALYNVTELNKLSIGYQFTKEFAFPIYYDYNPVTSTYKEYPMRTKTGFNAEVEQLTGKLPSWSRYIVPTETWLNCPETTFCLGRFFDAVFFSRDQYNALYDDQVHTLALLTDTPDNGKPLGSLFGTSLDRVDAAFTLGTMVFFISGQRVSYKTNIDDKNWDYRLIKDVFPGLECLVSAAVTKEDMAYVYCSFEDDGYVFQYEMDNKKPPNFTLIAKKAYKDVNAALPKSVSLVFTSEDKVVTMVHHFMIEQNSQTFFTQTEKLARFGLVNKYFGCKSENLEKKLTMEFVQKYIEFASPNSGVVDLTEPPDTQDSQTVSFSQETHESPSVNDDEDKNEVKGSGTRALIFTPSCIIQAVFITLLVQVFL